MKVTTTLDAGNAFGLAAVLRAEMLFQGARVKSNSLRPLRAWATMGTMRKLCLALVTALTSVFVAMPGCHSSDPASTDGCSDYASAFCAKMAACSPLDLRLSFN